MRRRRVITAAGIVVATALAGCVADDDDDDSGDDTGAGGGPPDERVDRPPHEPEQPPRPDPGEEAEWDDHWLGEGMATEPSLSFEQVTVPLTDRQLDASPPPDNPEYAVDLVTSENDLESRVDTADAPDRLQNVDFETEVVVIVESGYGSSSVRHVWTRVEEVEDGLYLHGHYTDPLQQTLDYGPRQSAVVVETETAADALAYVSLTVGEERRINVDSSEGVVSVEKNS